MYAQTNAPAVDASSVTTTKYRLGRRTRKGYGKRNDNSYCERHYGIHERTAHRLCLLDDTNGRTVSISGGGLTWSARGSVQANGNYHMEEFYAVAAGTLSAQTMTATFSGATSGGIVLNVFSVAGANTVSPFDSNSGLPAHATGASTAPSASVTTNNAYYLLISAISTGSAAAMPTCTVGNGFTRVVGAACTRAGTDSSHLQHR